MFAPCLLLYPPPPPPSPALTPCRRQRHVNQHVRKAAQAAALKDPQERLRRLQKTVAARGPLQPTSPPSHRDASAPGSIPPQRQQQQQQSTAGRASDVNSSSSGRGSGGGAARRTSQGGRAAAGSMAGGGPAAQQPGSARGSRHSSSSGGGSSGGGLPSIAKPTHPAAAGLQLPAVSPLLEVGSAEEGGEAAAGQGLLPAIRGAGRG
jgi:hypothetical protein